MERCGIVLVLLLASGEAWLATKPSADFTLGKRAKISVNAASASALHVATSLVHIPWESRLPTGDVAGSMQHKQAIKKNTAIATPWGRPNTQLAFRNTEHDEVVHANDFAPSSVRQRRFRVYCDLDGVLCDFSLGIRKLYQEHELREHLQSSRTDCSTFCVDDLHRGKMWQRVAEADRFFQNLPWMDSGRALWDIVRQLQPTILTGVPAHVHSSRRDKVEWCRRELGMPAISHTDKAGDDFRHQIVSSHPPTVSASNLLSRQYEHMALESLTKRLGFHWRNKNGRTMEDSANCCHIITCWSDNKHHESGPGAVLIDDRDELRPAWEAKGGIFVHHKGNADETIDQLARHGVLQEFLSH